MLQEIINILMPIWYLFILIPIALLKLLDFCLGNQHQMCVTIAID